MFILQGIVSCAMLIANHAYCSVMLRTPDARRNAHVTLAPQLPMHRLMFSSESTVLGRMLLS